MGKNDAIKGLIHGEKTGVCPLPYKKRVPLSAYITLR